MALINTNIAGDVVLLPNQAKAPAQERCSWLTDVVISDDGSEESYQVRNIARKQFEYEIVANQEEYQRVFNTIYGSIDKKWAIPIWTEVQNIGSILAAQTNISLNVDYFDYRPDSLALIWESPRKWQVVEIENVNAGLPGSIDIYGTTSSFTDAWIVPLRIGYVNSVPSRSTNSFTSSLRVSYNIDDIVEVPALTPDQYLSNDIYYDEWLMPSRRIDDRIRKLTEISDQELGIVKYKSPWINSRVSRPMKMILDTPELIYNFRRFLSRRSGRYRKFWQPSFDSDIRVSTTGFISDTMDIFTDDWDDHSSNRTHIAIEDSAGNWYAREIISSSISSATETEIVLDSNIDMNGIDIKRISYLGLKRFESDVIDINWIGGPVCDIEIRMLEITP